MPHTWDRLDDEPETAWTAFKAYRDQPLPRQMRLAAVHGRVTLAQAYELSQEWGWKERALDFDRHHEAVFQEEFEAQVRSAAKERAVVHTNILRTFRNALLMEVDKWHAVVSDNQSPTTTPAVLGKLVDIVLKLERLHAGEATSQSKQTFDFSKLSPEELLAMQGILSKSGMSIDDLGGVGDASGTLTDDETSPRTH